MKMLPGFGSPSCRTKSRSSLGYYSSTGPIRAPIFYARPSLILLLVLDARLLTRTGSTFSSHALLLLSFGHVLNMITRWAREEPQLAGRENLVRPAQLGDMKIRRQILWSDWVRLGLGIIWCSLSLSLFRTATSCWYTSVALPLKKKKKKSVVRGGGTYVATGRVRGLYIYRSVDVDVASRPVLQMQRDRLINCMIVLLSRLLRMSYTSGRSRYIYEPKQKQTYMLALIRSDSSNQSSGSSAAIRESMPCLLPFPSSATI